VNAVDLADRIEVERGRQPARDCGSSAQTPGQSKFLAVGAFVPWAGEELEPWPLRRSQRSVRLPTYLRHVGVSWDTKHSGEIDSKSHRNLPRLRSTDCLVLQQALRHFRTGSNC
jgi:hypothetical protein